MAMLLEPIVEGIAGHVSDGGLCKTETQQENPPLTTIVGNALLHALQVLLQIRLSSRSWHAMPTKIFMPTRKNCNQMVLYWVISLFPV